MLVVEAMLALSRDDMSGNLSDITEGDRRKLVVLANWKRKNALLVSLRGIEK